MRAEDRRLDRVMNVILVVEIALVGLWCEAARRELNAPAAAPVKSELSDEEAAALNAEREYAERGGLSAAEYAAQGGAR